MDQPVMTSTNTNRYPKIAFILIVVILLLVVAVFWSRKNLPTNSIPTNLPKEVVVEITERGFIPDKVTIAQGSAVRWVNKTNDKATVNSDDHPTHQKYKELNLGEFTEGSTLMHIFSNKGEYTYHDHFNPQKKGTIVVK